MIGNRKAIAALIGNTLFIDPSDITKEIIEKIQKQYNDSIKIVIAPIQTWMPATGTKVLMDEAVKCINAQNTLPKYVVKPQNRHERRAVAARNKHR